MKDWQGWKKDEARLQLFTRLSCKRQWQYIILLIYSSLIQLKQAKTVAHNWFKEKLRLTCALQKHPQGLVFHLFLLSKLFGGLVPLWWHITVCISTVCLCLCVCACACACAAGGCSLVVIVKCLFCCLLTDPEGLWFLYECMLHCCYHSHLDGRQTGSCLPWSPLGMTFKTTVLAR